MKLFSILALFLLFALSDSSSVASSGHVVGWGVNTAGEAHGVRSSDCSLAVVEVGGKAIVDAVAVAAGMNHGLALLANGSVVGWGSNRYGQAAVPRDLKDATAVAAGQYFSVALNGDGTVSAWGNNQFGQTSVPTNLDEVVAISAGMSHVLALKRDGSVVHWGRQSATMPSLSGIVAIAAGGADFESNLALKSNGRIVAWGSAVANLPADLTNVVQIAAGERHSLALKADGTVVGWGFNGSGEATGIPTLRAPYRTAGLVRVNGEVLTNVIAIATGNEYGLAGSACRYSVALRKNGSVVVWGSMGGQPANAIMGLTNVVAIAAGHNFCLAIQQGKQ